MATRNTKTPVMILQELIVKKGYSPPEYNLIYSIQGTHENIFHIQVLVCNITATGKGRSKKEAKHEAAKLALDILADKDIYHPDVVPETKAYTKENCSEGSPLKGPVNVIPKLLELCCENKVPMAQFREISAVGPPHCREFTYECYVSSIITRAKAGSKKHAKQLAAKEMLNRIISVIPEIQEQCESNQLKLLDRDMEVIDAYKELAMYNQGKINYNAKVIEYEEVLKKLMVERNLNQADILPYLSLPHTENTLEDMLRLFELKFSMEIIQSTPAIVVLAVFTDTPLSTMAMENSIAEATTMALEMMFKIIKKFIT